MNGRSLSVASAVAISIVACSGESPRPSEPLTNPGPGARTVASITFYRVNPQGFTPGNDLELNSTVLIGGSGPQQVWVILKDQYGSALTDRTVNWTTSNSQVAIVNPTGACGMAAEGCGRTLIQAAGDGSATITASSGGKTESFTVRSFMNPPEVENVNLDFKLVETGGDASSGWGYAPRLLANPKSGIGAVEVVGIRFTTGGLHSTWLCGTSVSLFSGQTTDLFPSVYGDFALVVGSQTRAGDKASATVFVLDQNGAVGKTSVSGPVVFEPPPAYETSGTRGIPFQLCTL